VLSEGSLEDADFFFPGFGDFFKGMVTVCNV
jgi:hypothetical protein